MQCRGIGWDDYALEYFSPFLSFSCKNQHEDWRINGTALFRRNDLVCSVRPVLHACGIRIVRIV